MSQSRSLEEQAEEGRKREKGAREPGARATVPVSALRAMSC